MYNAIKTELALWLGISKDALHIHLGLVIFAILFLVFLRSPGSLIPWLGVLAFELVNEAMDMFHWHGGAFSFEIGDSFKDIANTMIWPTIVTLGIRL
ncbi:MAG: hypothetical protein ABIY37_04375, partial [Devosia sp.]